MRLPTGFARLVAPTTTRVSSHTPAFMNQKILDHTLENLSKHASDQGWLEQRLASLDREWEKTNRLFRLMAWPPVPPAAN